MFPAQGDPELARCCGKDLGEPVTGISFEGFLTSNILFPETIHKQRLEKVPLKKCIELAKTWEVLATAHLETLRDNPDYRILLSDQMHYICKKYDFFVREQIPFDADVAVVDCLDQCVFSLLVNQPPSFYAKRFLRIASCYKQMADYFFQIGCDLAKDYSTGASNTLGEAVHMMRNQPDRRLEFAVDLAKYMRDTPIFDPIWSREILFSAMSDAEETKDAKILSGPTYLEAKKTLAQLDRCLAARRTHYM